MKTVLGVRMKKLMLLSVLGLFAGACGCATCPVCEQSCPTQTAKDAAETAVAPQEEKMVEIPQTNDMQEVYAFIKAQKTYYIATVEGDQPRVRPFGTVHIFEGKLYIQTGKKKDVSHQMDANPKIEIVAYDNKGTWIRVAAEVVADERIEAQESMLTEYPELRSMYTPGDGNNIVYYLKNATATFSSFGADKRVIQF